ncbi:DUF4124 domain-containing protein [Dyella sp. C9]|uniref:DUF4124 domain-containing protein n=1 Tax=Dyella sp. C9 TaxID=2202154 RepID=UPI000DEFACAB|nr:DUF4124 domain-containing protein [Dyella sp. C9]
MLLLLLLAPAAWAQQVYKWTDAQGTVHYSEQKPVGDAKVLRLQDHATGEAAEPSPAEATRDQQAGEPALERAEHEQRARMCGKARDNLKLLDSPALVLSHADVNTATRLSDEQREQARGEARDQIRMYCND